MYNLYCLGKADHFRLKDESNKVVLVFCFFLILNLLGFVGLFFEKIPPQWYSAKKHVWLFFLVRHKLTSGFLKLVLQHKSTVANAFRTVKIRWFGDVVAMPPALAVWKAEVLGRSRPVPFLLPAPPGRFALPDLIRRHRQRREGPEAAAMWGMLSLRTVLGTRPVIWGRAGHSCTSQHRLCFSR